MVTNGENSEFDMIITNEISRFSGNTLDKDSKLRLTIMSSIAQGELRKLSSPTHYYADMGNFHD